MHAAGRIYDLLRHIVFGHVRQRLSLAEHAKPAKKTLGASRTYARLLRAKLAEIVVAAPPPATELRAAFDRLNREIDACCEDQRLAA